MSDILELAKKLKRLAEQGIGGERENAAEMLERYMRKHGITMEQLSNETCKRREIRIDVEAEKFFCQVVASLFGRSRCIWVRPKERGKQRTQIIEVNESEYIELTATFDFYWRKYKEDLEIFYHAFVHKNKLTTKSSGKPSEHSEPLTEEEKQRVNRIVNMMQGLDKHHLRKQLEV